MKLKIGLFLVVLLAVIGYTIAYEGMTVKDTQCSTSHTVTYQPPTQTKTAQEFFNMGNYDYDKGNCLQAIADYTHAIALDPHVPEIYNNRGYSYMRLRNYQSAFADENKAISLNPNYVQALMNRGDLYNYYGPVIDRQKAIADYQKVISLGAIHNTSVCGHLAMAQTNNIAPLSLLKFITNTNCHK